MGPEVQRVPEGDQQRRPWQLPWVVRAMLEVGVCRPGAGALAVVLVTRATVVPRETPAHGAAMLVAHKIEGGRVQQGGVRQA